MPSYLPRSVAGASSRTSAIRLGWLLAEELNDPRAGGDTDEDALRTLLDAARRQLAGL